MVAGLMAGLLGCFSLSAASALIEGTVLDPSGAAVEAARVAVFTNQGGAVGEALTSPEGLFRLPSPGYGSYLLRVDARGFQPLEMRLAVGAERAGKIELQLDIAPAATAVTITASRAGVGELDEDPQSIATRNRDQILQRPLPTIGQALENTAGVLVQQTSHGQVSPVLRGLTGYQTLLLVDGVRYNTSIFRSGPNQYLAWIDPSQARGIEAILGPSSALYGSDSLGGSINVLSLDPRFSTGRRREFHGEAALFGASADASGGGSLLGQFGTSRLSWLIGASRRRQNDLRAGRGYDSHNVFLRFFGLTAGQVKDLLGPRLQDTGFTQTGTQSKLVLRPRADQSFTVQYLFDDQAGQRSYRDRLGGAGRLQATLFPQRLNLGYVRYEKLGIAFLDSLSGTFSINAQSDGYTRQNLRPTDPVQHDRSRISALGYAAQGRTHLGRRDALAFGGEMYRETVFSTRFTVNPLSGATTQDRALYPNGSRYVTSGLFAQNSVNLFRDRLRANLGARYSWVGYQTRASQNLSLGVADSNQSFDYFSVHSSLLLQLTHHASLFGVAGKGIRAPNVNDLGSIGLTTMGFDVPAAEAAAKGALMGLDGSESALSSGRPVGRLGAETLWNYEAGLRIDAGRLRARIQVFDAELSNPITGRTLLFPAGGAPASLAGYPVRPLTQTPAQQRQGVVAVATELAPRAVRSAVNDGASRYYGLESNWRWRLGRRWSLDGNYSFLAGRDLFPNRPARRLPPQQFYTGVRYTALARCWLELTTTFSGSQYRVNGADLDDDRMGASRRRGDIADFFRGGFAAPFIDRGVFRPTGETLGQIQDRVLPLGAAINGVRVASDSTRVPLYPGSGQWWIFGLRGGVPLGERLVLNFSALNLADRNYRVHGSGTDAPGLNVSLSLRYSF
ncbi:MAG: TonB-dependent receptor [Acidobacteria bacterium]|nr:TonB-dependent receptor [Acidobacteriota bacterium]